MSRTHKGQKGPGHEYWSRRFHGHHLDPGSFNKKRTARYERRQGKEQCRREPDRVEPDDLEYWSQEDWDQMGA